MRKCFRRALKFIKPAAARADPQRAFAILKDGPNFIVAQAARIVRVVLVMLENALRAIKEVQPAAIGSNPKRAGAIFVYGRDILVA
ncbi:MAG: hypothetical protein ALAOOOJD_01463 [bacterium]|nr:hypothetical protein [bacterium]